MLFFQLKKGVVIDSCTLGQDSSLMQQASSLTNGLYFKIPNMNGILNYLLWLFLPDVETRKMLVYPPKTEVDFRAACFCHHKLIDIGYVCSVCLSVFCSFTPICTTCNTNFKFDVQMLKKAPSFKYGSFRLQASQQQQQNLLRSNSNSNSSTNNIDDYVGGGVGVVSGSGSSTRLNAQFKDAQIASPGDNSIISDEQMTNEMEIDQQQSDYFNQQPITRIISAQVLSNGSNKQVNPNQNLNDSLDMLE
jgi:hypothetical protein